jgi:hypothetical protein
MMAPHPAQAWHVNEGDPAYRQVAVSEIAGGSKRQWLLGSAISAVALRGAIDSALNAAGYLAPNSATAELRLRANLVRHDRPRFSFTTVVTTAIRYRATLHSTGVVLLDTLIQSTGRVPMSEAFIGTTRLRLANEAAIRANLACLFRVLGTTPGIATADSGQPSSANSSRPEVCR